MKKKTVTWAVLFGLGAVLWVNYGGRQTQLTHQPKADKSAPVVPAVPAQPSKKSAMEDKGSAARAHNPPYDLTAALADTNIMTQLSTLERLKIQVKGEDPAVVAEWMGLVAAQGNGNALKVMIYMMQANPQAALLWFGDPANQTSLSYGKFFRNSLINFANSSPMDALGIAEILPKGSEVRKAATQSVVYGLAKEDLQEAIKAANKLFEGSEAAGPIAVAFAVKAETDPKGALAILEKTAMSPSAREMALGNILKSWVYDNPAAAIDLLKNSSSAVISRVLAGENANRSLIRYNPQEFAGLLGRIPQTADGVALLDKNFSLLVGSAPDVAGKWIQDQPSGNTKNSLLSTFYQETSKVDPAGAMAAARSLAGEDQVSAIKGIMRSQGSSDLAQSLDLLRNVEPGRQQEVYQELAKSCVYGSSSAAVQLLEDPTVSGILGADFRSEMVDHTVQTWARQNLEAARSWVEKLPASDQAQGVQGLMIPWLKSDPVAASEWLAQLPAGAARDAGARVAIEQTKDTDPERAEQWRRSLSQEASGKN